MKHRQRFASVTLAASAAALALPAKLHAQEAVIAAGWQAGNFFMALIAGLLLALAFQFVFSLLSAALGISFLGSLEAQPGRAPAQPAQAARESGGYWRQEDESPMVKISHAAGIWTLVTASLSLFLATLLAVRFSLLPTDRIAVTLGLVIWAAFVVVVTLAELRMAQSVLGGLARTVAGGLRASGQSVRALFRGSESRRTEKLIRHSAEALRKEISKTVDTRDIRKRIDAYLNKLQPPRWDPEKLREAVAQLIDDITVREEWRPEYEGAQREIIIEMGRRRRFNEEQITQIRQAYDEALQAYRAAPGGRAEKVMAAAERLSPQGAQLREKRRRLEDKLRDMQLEELNPEALKADLEHILQEPKSTKQVVLTRLSQFDHNTLVTLAQQKKGVTPEKAERWVSRIEHVFEDIKRKADKPNGSEGFRQRAEKKVEAFFNSLERPEFDYEAIKEDIILMFEDPLAAPEVLRERFAQYDRDSLIALLSRNKRVAPEQAERIANSIDSARAKAVEKAEHVEQAVRERLETAKRQALRQAEQARRATSAAAWWMTATTIVSGIAAAFGGYLAVL